MAVALVAAVGAALVGVLNAQTLGHPLPQTAEEADECAGWLNGSLDTYHDAATRSWTRGGFTSQFRQDKTVFNLLFRDRNTQGVYVDVASNHYKRISNTYFYDRCLGWQGVCVEPNPIYHDELQRLRSCELFPTCASNSTDEVELKLPVDTWIGALGGINGGRMKEYVKQIEKSKRLSVAKRMRCVRVGDELRRLGVGHVDLFSLDVEGHERAVLDGIDFCSLHISHIICEANCDSVLRGWGYAASKPRGLVQTEVLWTRPQGSLPSCGRRPHRSAAAW